MSDWRTDEHDAMYESETVLWWYVALREYVLDWLHLTETTPRPVLTLLDAGCGTGGMLARLAPFGVAVGLDLAPHAVRIARDRRGCIVTRGSLDRAALPRCNLRCGRLARRDLRCGRGDRGGGAR